MCTTETSTSTGERHYRRRFGVDRRTTRPSTMPIRLGGVFPRFVTPFRIISQSSHTYTNVRLQRAQKKSTMCVNYNAKFQTHVHTMQDYVSTIWSDMLGGDKLVYSRLFALPSIVACGGGGTRVSVFRTLRRATRPPKRNFLWFLRALRCK